MCSTQLSSQPQSGNPESSFGSPYSADGFTSPLHTTSSPPNLPNGFATPCAGNPEARSFMQQIPQNYPHTTPPRGFYPSTALPGQLVTAPAEHTCQVQTFDVTDFTRGTLQPSSDPINSKPKRKRVINKVQRKAANVRERKRMFNLNEAFDQLRTKIPKFSYEKKMSRIETLRLAITYISFMTDVLQGIDPEEVKLPKLDNFNFRKIGTDFNFLF